jgi:pimeloyl-ACP methyl ester carboxylesterase
MSVGRQYRLSGDRWPARPAGGHGSWPAGGLDVVTPPRYGRVVADLIPGARFEVLPQEAHQPFPEVPDSFNARFDAFWREVEAG